jgi:hypothetical protein
LTAIYGHDKLESLLIGHHILPSFASSQYPSVIDQFPLPPAIPPAEEKRTSILQEVFHAHQIAASEKQYIVPPDVHAGLAGSRRAGPLWDDCIRL